MLPTIKVTDAFSQFLSPSAFLLLGRIILYSLFVCFLVTNLFYEVPVLVGSDWYLLRYQNYFEILLDIDDQWIPKWKKTNDPPEEA